MLDKTTEWALYLLVFSIPFSKSIIEVSVVTAIVSWGLRKLLVGDFTVKKTSLNWLLVAFFIASALSIVNTELKALVVKSLVSKCLKYIILYFIIVETINSEVRLKNILKIGIISAAIVTVDAYIQHYLTNVDIIRLYPAFKFVRIDPSFRGFPTGPFPFPNDLSAWLIIALSPTLYLFMWDMKGKVWRYLLGAFSLSLLFLFYLTNTRSAWLSFFAAFAITLLIQKKKLIIVLILVAKQKVEDMIGFTSMQDRFYMWRIGWKIFLEHPVIGNGFNTFFVKFKEFRTDEYKNIRGSHAHNGYLQFVAEIGILGLSVFLLLIGKAFFSIFRYLKGNACSFYRTFAFGLSAGLLAFLIHSFFDTNLQSLPLAALFWFCLAILMGLRDIEYARET